MNREAEPQPAGESLRSPRQRLWVSPGVRVSAVAAVLVVAAVAAVMSYGHLRAVAAAQGEPAAVLFPLSVDGLIVAASLVLLVRRRSGQPGGVLAWTGLLVGIAATVAGNVASAEPTLAARLVAAWPPVAFALSYELLLALIRPAPPAEPPEPAERANGVGDPAPAGRADRAPVDTAASRTGPASDEWAERGAGGLQDRARELIAAAADGRPPGRRVLARRLGVSEHQARTVLAAVSRNGTTSQTGTSDRMGEEPNR